MSRFKTELCNNLIELGSCKYGERCHYAHGTHELRQVTRRHPKYRTERCKNFEQTGKCPFGPRCSYVHPKPDLESLVEQLTRYVHHTKAPKPDSEDDDDGENVNNLFSRTATSASLYSASDSTISTISNSNQFLADTEANKENQLFANDQNGFNPLSVRQDIFKQTEDNKNDCLNPRFQLENQPQRTNPSQPLTSIKNQQNLQIFSNNQRSAQQNSYTKVIERPHTRGAMQAISKNIQTINQQLELPLFKEQSNCDYIPTPPPPPQFSSPPCSPSQGNGPITNNLFGISNQLSDFFINTAAETNSTQGGSILPNKQYYARF